MDACLNCPAIPADEGFLKEAPGGGLRSDSSGGVSLPEGPFVLPPPETGSVELKGFVSSDADLPEWPRPGWMVIADQEGVYGGVALSAGDALVCAGTSPPVWLPLAGALGSDIDASRLTGTASVDTTGSAATADRTNHGLSVGGLSFDGSSDVSLSAGDGLAVSVSGGGAELSLSPTGVAPGQYHAVTVGADGRVTLGSNPVTLAGHGIQDAYTKQEIDSRLTSGMHYRGSVPTQADLPVSGSVAGDFWNVVDTGNNYAWDGTEWDYVGNLIDFVPITNEAIDDVTEH